MKEHAKLYKKHKNRTVHQLSKRLSAGDIDMFEENKGDKEAGKRRNLGGGQFQSLPPSQPPSQPTGAKK
jgi:hypothetical protein